jgi:hypothetical protein
MQGFNAATRAAIYAVYSFSALKTMISPLAVTAIS